MKYILICALTLFLTSCSFKSVFENKKSTLEKEIVILKLEIKKAKLENSLEKVERLDIK